MSSMARAIAWPVLSLLVIGGTHLVAEAIRPQLHEVIVPAVAMPIYLVVGGWASFAVIRAGGTFVHGLLAGAILGVLPAMLQVVGFGLLLGKDGAAVQTSALFGFMAMFWGATLGGAIAASLAPARAEDAAREGVGQPVSL